MDEDMTSGGKQNCLSLDSCAADEAGKESVEEGGGDGGETGCTVKQPG